MQTDFRTEILALQLQHCVAYNFEVKMVKPLLNTYELSWKPDKERIKKPFYLSLAHALKEDILHAVLPAYTKLPPQRELARYLDLNVSTVTKAYKLCETNGLVTAVVGRGTFVAPLGVMSHPFSEDEHESDEDVEEQVADSFSVLQTKAPKAVFQNGDSKGENGSSKGNDSYIKSFIPDGVVNMAYQKVASIHNDAIRSVGISFLESSQSANLFGNTAYLGSRFQMDAGKIWLEDLGVKLSEESSLFITMGVTHTLSVVLSSLFQPGVAVAIDTYTSPYAAAALSKLLHAKMVPINSDDEGMSASAFESACRVGKVKVLFALPAGVPTGKNLSHKRKKEIAAVAKKHNVLVIEDDYLVPFQESPSESIYSFIPEQTIYISSVSQALSSGLRITYVAMPRRYKRIIAEALFASMYKLPPFDAEVAARIISQGLHKKLIAEKRDYIRERNRLFTQYFPQVKTVSLALGQWVSLPSDWTGLQVEKELRERGVQVLCAERFALGEKALDTAIYVATCGPDSLEQLDSGLRIIKAYFDDKTR